MRNKIQKNMFVCLKRTRETGQALDLEKAFKSIGQLACTEDLTLKKRWNYSPWNLKDYKKRQTIETGL
jgi:hypothetical protein